MILPQPTATASGQVRRCEVILERYGYRKAAAFRAGQQQAGHLIQQRADHVDMVLAVIGDRCRLQPWLSEPAGIRFLE